MSSPGAYHLAKAEPVSETWCGRPLRSVNWHDRMTAPPPPKWMKACGRCEKYMAHSKVPKKEDGQECWALLYYNAARPHKYRVLGRPAFVGPLEVFTTEQNGLVYIHASYSGALLLTDKNRMNGLAKLRRLVAKTPDLREELAKLGPVAERPEVTREYAVKMDKFEHRPYLKVVTKC